MNFTDFDIIGDIHGHATELMVLLNKMGYELSNGYYQHPTRKVLFVGDYIDRGPEIREVLGIVKGMTDNDQAIALMGNHEYNCLCFNTKGSDGDYLRKHTQKNIHQHKVTIDQFKNYQKDWKIYLDWMWNLPLWYDSTSFRAVHACWSESVIASLQSRLEGTKLSRELIEESCNEESDLFEWIETTLKGKELPLPEGITFPDKDGHPRSNVRIKWWMKPENTTYGELKVNPEYDVPDVLVDPNHPILADVYAEEAKPVFFGHYWLRGTPSIYRSNVCCLDYSVAKKGKLVAYRYAGERILSNSNLTWCS